MPKFEHLTFCQPAADRCSIERCDDAWVLAQKKAPATRFVITCGTSCLVDASFALAKLTREELPRDWQDWPSIFLGIDEDVPVFALSAPESRSERFREHGTFSGLRPVAMSLSPEDASLVAHARAVFHWHDLNRFCGGCGGELVCSSAGHTRRCGDADCMLTEIFPRIDPAVIMLVTHGEHCLLGRQAAWPPCRYSCLAGFMEAGETLEETVRREVREESGVQVGDVHYYASQPWPFPQSLMVGFHAIARSTEITLHDDELEDARWFSRADIRSGLESGQLRLATPLSIAYALIREWYAEGDDPALLDRYAEIS